MRISKRLKIAALVPILLTTVIGFTLIICNKSIEDIRGQARQVRQIMNGMKELNTLAYSYLINPEERPQQQFLLQYDAITRMVATMRLTSIAPQQLHDIRRDSDNIKATFFKLVSNRELISPAEPASKYRGGDERLAGQLLIQLNDVLSDILSLEVQLDRELATTQKRINWLIFFIISSTTVAMTILLLRMTGIINASLATIHAGAELIGSGSLGHRIGLTTADEFGELSRAFDRMAAKLQISSDELRLEVEERTQIELELRNKERFLTAIADGIPGMVGYWTNERRCAFANKGYQTWFGKSPAEMRNIRIEDFLGEKLFRQNEPFINSALLGVRQQFHISLVKPNGNVGYLWAHYIPDMDGDMVRGFHVLVSDITELKQAQLQLEEINEILKQRTEEAEQASRSKSRFLATVAHEFRTPLSLLVSSTDILDCYGERLGKAQLIVQNAHIRSAALQISKLIDSVMSFNQLETARYICSPVLLDVERVCSVIADEVNTVWSADHDFQLMISVGCGTALLDEILFRRVLENLLTNAFRYTPAGGVVSLHVKRVNNRLFLEISDSGIGIPPDDQERIFDAFYRGGNVANRRGLGLGLSIVREALLKMEGGITLTSSSVAGTTVRVQIPVKDEIVPLGE